jgi:hypothetical protein
MDTALAMPRELGMFLVTEADADAIRAIFNRVGLWPPYI